MTAITAIITAAVSLLTILPASHAHMVMSYPPPRGYTGNSAYSPKDYDLSSPIKSVTMCKGKPAGPPTATFSAGEVVNGTCQFALSYDNDKTFYVIQEIQGACPDSNYQWPVKLPDGLPSCDRCTFAWTWINAIGNREYYMNCADVTIRGRTGPSPNVRGTPLKLANLPGYPTVQPPVNNNGPSGSTVHYYPLQPF